MRAAFVGLLVWCSIVAMSFATTPTTRSERLAYCLGGQDLDTKIKSTTAELERRMKNFGGKVFAADMNKFAEQSRQEGLRLRAELRRLGVISNSEIRNPEVSFYDEAYKSGLACYKHGLNACVQTCYRQNGFPEDEKSWRCERACGLPQSCKQKIDCKEFNSTS